MKELIVDGLLVISKKKRINEAAGLLQFWTTIAKKDVSNVEYIKDRFIERLVNVLNESAMIQEG